MMQTMQTKRRSRRALLVVVFVVVLLSLTFEFEFVNERKMRDWKRVKTKCEPIVKTITKTERVEERAIASSQASVRSSIALACEDPLRVDALIRSHACEEQGDGENEYGSDLESLKALPKKPNQREEKSSTERRKMVSLSATSIERESSFSSERRKGRKMVSVSASSEDDDPAVENEEMQRVLARFQRGEIEFNSRKNVFYKEDDADDDSDDDKDLEKVYKTCAVVGNSGILQKTAYGAMIDSSDAVFRVNDGVAKRGCSLYAGSRTTFRVIDAKSLGKMEIFEDDKTHGNGTIVVLVNADKSEQFSAIKNSEYFNHALKVRRLHADVKDGAIVLLHSFRENLAKQGKMQGAGGNLPSTGMLSFYLALRLCDFVGLYGFGLYVEKDQSSNTNNSRKKSSSSNKSSTASAVHDFYRYYDARRTNAELGMRQTHSFDTERMLMSLISTRSSRSKLCGFKKDGAEDEIKKRIRREQDRHARQLSRRTGRQKVKASTAKPANNSASDSDTATRTGTDANSNDQGGFRVLEERPIEHTVDWEQHL